MQKLREPICLMPCWVLLSRPLKPCPQPLAQAQSQLLGGGGGGGGGNKRKRVAAGASSEGVHATAMLLEVVGQLEDNFLGLPPSQRLALLELRAFAATTKLLAAAGGAGTPGG